MAAILTRAAPISLSTNGSPVKAGDRQRVLLLTPSCGLGGGIERYAETVEWAFADQSVEHRRIDLHNSGPVAHARMLAEARRQLRMARVPTRLVLLHRALLPVASVLARDALVQGTSVICHGSDVWDKLRPRRYAELRLMRLPRVRVIGVSSFTAGALAADCPAAVLPPGLSRTWFQTLVSAADEAAQRSPGIGLVTAFRLADWRDKGLPQLLSAVAALGRADVSLAVCGSGEPPADLRELVRQHPYCELKPGLTDRGLAQELAAADLFVLATRTRPGRHASGEGFGLVLLEAQVAGTPVVGPAFGGSHDAFLDHVTGVAPADETAESLRKVLDDLISDGGLLDRMGRLAAEWSRECFAPDRYAARAVATLL
jgi:phosphatidyl-myo-inositol dimannoside synthase